MSTHQLESELSPATAESSDTELIARLAKEFYSDLSVPAAGSIVPDSGFPHAVAGLPSLPSDSASDFFETPGSKAGDASLAHGYPVATVASHPPVHPALASQDDRLESIAPSGAHDPASAKSYPFGEPIVEGALNGAYTISTASPVAKNLPHIESPEFYFLDSRANTAAAPARESIPTLTVFDVEAIRRDFPVLNQNINGHRIIWLDNAATTQKPNRVVNSVSDFYRRDNSNIHRAAHTLARRSTDLFEAGREKVRQFLGAADTKEIVFVRGTTEAVNLVAQSYGRKHIGQGDEIILTELEHHANIVPWQLLAEQVGAVIRVAPINDKGEVLVDEFANLLGPRTKFVSVAHVSNALGTIVPVEEIVALSHARSVPVLIDGAQSAPHFPVNVTAIDADFYVFSGHKIFGPTGIGALYGKRQLLEDMPPYQGGGHMIRDVRFEKTTYQNAPEKFEAGTQHIAGVVGLAAAIDYITNVGIAAIASYEHALLDHAANGLATVPGLRPIGTANNKASVLSFIIPGIPIENIARHLDNHGIAVRAGHHCALPAHRHFGLEGTVRPSLAFYNTYEEVDTLVQVLQSLPRDKSAAPSTTTPTPDC
jgi:cysteine desulfurase / selenocysteine lyase